ncbi:MAG: hypothetical protein ABSF90_10370 [Syntrophobacteraceae bacterium]|jgi:RNA polymerase subunit RPABC4/transcription elongation factor Spt4
MALKKCHECGKDISTGASNCPRCGASQIDWIRDGKWLTGCIIIIFAIIAAFVFVMSFVFPVSNDNHPAVVKLSPAEQAKADAKTHDPNLHFTKEGCVACLTKEDIDRFAVIVTQKDWGAVQKMLLSFDCISYPIDSPVYIMESPGFIKVKIRIKGSTEGLWTLRSFID